MIVLDRWFLDGGIWLQVGQLSHPGLAEAVVAQAFYDAADLWSRSQSTMGIAQCDFGEAVTVISGVECKVLYFVLDLPHSDGCFVKAYPGETTEAFLACTTITSWPWPKYWATDDGSAHTPLPSCSPTTGSGVLAKGMSKAWWTTRGAISWCGYRRWRVFRR